MRVGHNLINYSQVTSMDIDQHIEKLFRARWCGENVLSSVDNMKAQLAKTLKDQLAGYWSGSTAYSIATQGGFLVDSKFGSTKKLTERGELFLRSMALVDSLKEVSMSMSICASDFTPINVGILSAEKDGNEFIFQRPFAYDKSRAAQSCCVLFINNSKQNVEEFDDALLRCNEFLAP